MALLSVNLVKSTLITRRLLVALGIEHVLQMLHHIVLDLSTIGAIPTVGETLTLFHTW